MDAIQAAIAKARAARATALTGETPPPPEQGGQDRSAGQAQVQAQIQDQTQARPQDPSRPAAPAPDPASALASAATSASAPGPAAIPLPQPAGSLPGSPAESPSGPAAEAPSPPGPLRLGGARPAAARPVAAPADAARPPPPETSPQAAPKGPGDRTPADAAAAPPAAALAPAAPAAPDTAADAALRRRWQALPEFVPQPKLLARNHIVTARGGREAAPFDQMRTRLLQQMRANNWRRVAITSPGPGCGKSTVALNLALSLARQTELRTVLVELDLRRPSLARLLGLRPPAPPQDFARVLDARMPEGRVTEGHDAFAAQAARIGTNLAFSTCRGPVRNSAELLHSPAAAAALRRIEEDYAPSIFLFDTPPVLMVDDAMAVMGQMDCALIVAAAENTRIAEIDRCERELASQTNVLGVVLNKCRYLGQGYDYGYYGG